MDLTKYVRTVPDFPKKGIMFRDITTLLQNPEAFRYACDQLADRYKDNKPDVIVGIESRGFIFGAAMAYKLGIPFALVRKPGKLPFKTIKQEYSLEYGTDAIEMHVDAVKKGDRVLIVDDLIATGGTVAATAKLVEELGGEIMECAFVIDLPDLKGKEKISQYKIFTLIEFEGD